MFRFAAFVVLIGEAGRAIVAKYQPASRGLERCVLMGVSGFVAVSGIAFLLALTGLVYERWWVIAAVSVAIVAVLRRDWLHDLASPEYRRLSAFERRLALLAVVVFLVYFVRYEPSHFYYGCLHSSVAWTIGEPIGHIATTPIERILFFHQDAQIGGTTIVAPFAAMLGPLGERVLLGFAPAAILLTTALTLRRLYSERTATWAAIILGLNPWLLRLPQISVNTLAWMAGAALVFLFVHRRSGFLAGVVCGFYVGVLYINVLVAPILIYWAWKSGDSFRFRRFLAGLGLVALALAVQNTVAHGDIFSYGSFRTVAETGHEPFQYSFLGMSFTSNALFNWPLFDHVVRTPMNPMPVFLLMPLAGLRFFGIAIAALFLVGPRRLRETDSAAFVAAAAWTLIIAGILLVQENWLQVEKMHTPFDLFPALALFLGAGIERLKDESWRSWAPRYVAALMGLSTLAAAAPRWNVPADERFLDLFPRFPKSEGEYLEDEGAPYFFPRVLPDFSELSGAFRRGIGRRLWRDLSRSAEAPRPESARETMLRAMIPAVYYGFMMPRGAMDEQFLNRESLPTTGDARLYSLDVGKVPMGNHSPIDLITAQTETPVDLQSLPAQWTAPTVEWSDQPVTVLAFVYDRELYFVLKRPLDPRIEKFEGLFDTASEVTKSGTTERPWKVAPLLIPTREWPSSLPHLVFRASPGQVVHVIDAVYLDPSRIYWRRFELGRDRIAEHRWIYWHAN